MAKKLDSLTLRKLMRSNKKTPEKKITYLLEHTNVQAIQEAKKYSEKLIDFQWKYYYELAQQREKVLDKINGTLLKNVTDKYIFQKWQRAVKWEYTNHPMCSNGSTTYIGQRFNYGNEINSQISCFPCLYLAVDKDTALQETLGQSAKSQMGLSAKEIALSNPQSESIVSVSGILDQIIDLRSEKSLKDFIKIIAGFKLSKELTSLAKSLDDEAGVITNAKLLKETFLEDDWRLRPVQYQIPANSQIFGSLVNSAGIQGILYPSKLTGKDCLAVFTQNFKDSDSHLIFDDAQPDPRIPKKIDSHNFKLTMQSYAEIINLQS